MFGTVTLSLKNHVSPTDKYVPATGVFSVSEKITGFKWDRKSLESSNFPETQFRTTLGGIKDSLTDGTKLTHWQSGTVTGLKYKFLANYKQSDTKTWTPVFDVGSFSMHWDERTLYSDYSFVDKVSTTANADGVSEISLRSDAVVASLTARIFYRSPEKLIFTEKSYDYVEEFTGSISGTARQSTVDGSGNVIWANIEDRKDEFIVDGTTVYFNKDTSIVVGEWTASAGYTFPTGAELDDVFEAKGNGQSSGRDCYTDFFPVKESSVSVWTYDGFAVQSWTEVDTLNFSRATDYHFVVDEDLGIITLGGYQAPSLRLSEAIDDVVTTIPVHPELANIDSYPAQGIVTIGSEEILYLHRSDSAFLECTRGYNSTTAVAHLIGAEVSDIQHGAGTADPIYIAYTAVPRVEYEVTDYTLRSANRSTWLDVRPLNNVKTNNIVQILSADIDLATITLTTSSDFIGGNIYGPVSYGTDYSKMTATAFDSRGNRVEDIPLTISIDDGPGVLNGAGNSATGDSNSEGEFSAFFNSPYSFLEIEKLASSVVHDGADTEMTIDGLTGTVDPSDVWVFQVLKHDKTLGTIGDKLDIISISTSTSANAISQLVVDGLIDEKYKGSYLYLEDGVGTLAWREIVNVFPTTYGPSNLPATLVQVGAYVDPAFGWSSVYLFERDSTEYNPAALNGARVILYEYTVNAIHPITGVAGAYMPVRADSITGNVLRFNGRNLPIPDLNDRSNNLAAYVVIAPSLSSLSATGKDPVSGRIITSNTIRLQLDLPTSLSGVDESGALPVPYGWTFPTEVFNVGAAIGGANFITINPAASGINQFALVGSF